MIAVDTNVLVRLLVGDDADQAGRAKQLFDRAAAQGRLVWISDTVLVELAWTLSRAYGRDRADIVIALRALGDNATVSLESALQVAAAIDIFEQGPADFADCLLCAKAAAAGCDHVATFDRGMRGLPTVKLL
ncbi:MAG: type II toxin-antitoxin system VapC family toxin [Ideonella sp.]|nr:type II toxin-antitoxin system VapC family toxin [Ideonella sp.]MBE7427095.1 type II toxin-antitoxin system VapC family toxin [Ideonella sp.]MCC7457737.1 type II toxin-antitoxin system VapC family toxin [Nitrospira sp.]